jgi:hypothetical protein
MSSYEQVADRIAAREAAKLRARAIIESAEDLEAVVKHEVGRIVSEEIRMVQDVLHEGKLAIEAAPEKNPRLIVIKWLDKMSNRLSVISAGYAAGSLPKVQK